MHTHTNGPPLWMLLLGGGVALAALWWLVNCGERGRLEESAHGEDWRAVEGSDICAALSGEPQAAFAILAAFTVVLEAGKPGLTLSVDVASLLENLARLGHF